MKNYRQSAESMRVLLSDTVKGGDVVVVEDVVGIAVTDGDGVNLKAVRTEGVFSLPKASGAISQGKTVYWDATNKVITTTADTNPMLGYVWEPAFNSDTTALVMIRN